MTKEYSSVVSLRKPFKTPFKTVTKVPLIDAHQNGVDKDQQLDPVVELSDNDEVVIIEENIHQQDDNEPAINLPDVCSCELPLQYFMVSLLIWPKLQWLSGPMKS